MLDELVSKTLKMDLCGIDELSQEKRFKPYVTIIDYMNKLSQPMLGFVFTDDEVARSRLFSICLKAIDDDIDNSNDKNLGEKYLKDMINGVENVGSLSTYSEFMLQAIHVLGEKSDRFYDDVVKLYEFNAREGSLRSMEEYIQNRILVGIFSANVSIDVVRPSLFEERPRDVKVYQDAICCACLMDSVADYRKDLKNGVYGFTPKRGDFSRLVGATTNILFPLIRNYPIVIPEVTKASFILLYDNLKSKNNQHTKSTQIEYQADFV